MTADLLYAISMSLDGFIADDKGNIDWGQPSDDAHRFFNELQRSVGTLLCGRRLYETMRIWDTWAVKDLPEVQREFADAWLETDKVVYSTTLDDVPEPRTRLRRTFDPNTIEAMKRDSDHDLSIGGADLAGQAIRAGVVDRCALRVVPVVIGGGTRALPIATSLAFTLTETRPFEDGSVLLDYRLT